MMQFSFLIDGETDGAVNDAVEAGAVNARLEPSPDGFVNLCFDASDNEAAWRIYQAVFPLGTREDFEDELH